MQRSQQLTLAINKQIRNLAKEMGPTPRGVNKENIVVGYYIYIRKFS
jgi:hypothetical protein